MVTARGWWFLAGVVGLLVVGLGGLPRGWLPPYFATSAPVIAIVALALVAWFFGNWLAFALRVRLAQSNLRIERRLEDAHGELHTLWARLPVGVQVSLHNDGPALPHVSVLDRLPVLAQRRDGEPFAEGRLAPDEPLSIAYRIECPAPGRLRFDGLRLRIIDLLGFFTTHLFVRQVRIYRVLPALADASGLAPAPKRHNIIPLMGTHRHRRAGAGSDLLDLRDYLPGDPPKMIAWKASARRDRLMTKELESEVPIRCTLFIDTSNSTRVGPVGRNALARLLEIASAVVQANGRARDLTGFCLIDEHGVQREVRPGRGSRHVVRLMRAIADAGDLFPRTPAVPLRRLISHAYGLIQDIYPDLLESDLNSFPIWLPLWSPQPHYTIPEKPSPPGARWTRPLRRLWRQFRESPLAIHRWRLVRLIPYQHRLYRWRKQIAAILAVRYGLDPGGLAILLEDDERCRYYLEKFLTEHQLACPQPLYDEEGRYLFQAPAKIGVFSEALLRAVKRGQDNELFVLLVDLLHSGPDLQKLLRAVRLARGKKHQVILLCPWPTGVPLPDRTPTAATQRSKEPSTLQEHLARASATRVHRAYAELCKTFGRLGVTVLAAAEDDAVRMILYRMHRLRVYQRGVR